MKPVEKMAARLLARHKLSPPYDLDQLAEIYGKVEYLHIPFEADGITIGIGGEDKPQIIVNDSSPDTRKKFTLAHELGHIVIPWHTGTIVSHIDNVESNFEYKEMEAEANQFAAELLIPRAWLIDIQNSFPSFKALVEHVLNSTGASRDAVFIKIFNTIEFPVVCVQIDDLGVVVNCYRSRSVHTYLNLLGRNVYSESIFTTEASEEYFDLGDRSYKAWIFIDDEISEVDSRPWREVLSQILEETNSQELQQSINATLAYKCNSNKEKSELELSSIVMRAYDGQEMFEPVLSHPLFSQYVIKRVKELKTRKKT